MDMFTCVGDALALQYGGSETNKRVGEKEEGREEGGKEGGREREGWRGGKACRASFSVKPAPPSLPPSFAPSQPLSTAPE